MLHRWRQLPRPVARPRLFGSPASTTAKAPQPRIRDSAGSPFHPAVTRHLKHSVLNASHRRQSLPLPLPLNRVVKQAAYLLRIIDGGKFVTMQGTVRRHIISESLSRPGLFDAVCKLDLGSVEELQACAASLAVLLPRAGTLLDLDALFARSILHASAVDKESHATGVGAPAPYCFEVPLLCSFALLQACAERGMDARQLATPNLVLGLIAERARGGGGRMELLLPVPHEGATHTTRCVDQLAMAMYTLAAASSAARASRSTADAPQHTSLARSPPQTHAPLSAADTKVLLSLLTGRCERILEAASALKHEVDMSSLRVVWEAAAGLQLPNAYSMYKAMYEAVLRGLEADPLQLPEEAVTTLLESMYTSRFKHSRLIHTLGEPIRQHGSRFDRCGARLFSALVALESMPLALELLDGMMKAVSESASNEYGHRALSKVRIACNHVTLLDSIRASPIGQTPSHPRPFFLPPSFHPPSPRSARPSSRSAPRASCESRTTSRQRAAAGTPSVASSWPCTASAERTAARATTSC